MDEAQYRLILRAPERALQQMLLDFQFFVEDHPGFTVFARESRLKGFDSATAKAHRLGVDVAELNDLAGARIVAASASSRRRTAVPSQMSRLSKRSLPGTRPPSTGTSAGGWSLALIQHGHGIVTLFF